MIEMKYNEWIEDDFTEYEYEGEHELIEYSYYFDDNNYINYWLTCREYTPYNDSDVYIISSIDYVVEKEYYTWDDLDYELYIEWFDNKDSVKELEDITNILRGKLMVRWNKIKENHKWQ